MCNRYSFYQFDYSLISLPRMSNSIYEYLKYIYFINLTICFILSLIRFKSLDKGTKLISINIVIGMLSELIARYWVQYTGNNFIIYNIYSILDMVVVLCYFYTTNDVAKFKSLVKVLIPFSLLFWIGNTYLYESLDGTQLNFIIYQSLLTTGLCLYSIYLRLSLLNLSIYTRVHLFIPFIILLFQIGGFVNWIFFEYVIYNNPEHTYFISIGIISIGVTYYFCLLCILLGYNKLNKKLVI